MTQPGTFDILQQILNGIDRMPAALRQGVADEIWARLPSVVDESQFVAALAPGVPLVVAPQYGTYEVITCVVASVPTGATGLVQLGSTIIPVGAGLSVMPHTRKILAQSDVRSLTIAGATGAAALWLTGEQQPTFGVMGP